MCTRLCLHRRTAKYFEDYYYCILHSYFGKRYTFLITFLKFKFLHYYSFSLKGEYRPKQINHRALYKSRLLFPATSKERMGSDCGFKSSSRLREVPIFLVLVFNVPCNRPISR
jgi:hypothetical protein